jgi:uroporphyrinogen-III decarboxylase
VEAVLSGQKPDRLPFIDRLQLWYDAHRYADTMPAQYAGMTVEEVHEAVGIGHFKFVDPYALRLCGVELICRFGERMLRRETDPLISGFPTRWGSSLVPHDEAGVTEAELIAPSGRLRIGWQMAESMIGKGILPYVKEHPVKGEEDYATAIAILERADVVPLFDQVYAAKERMGGSGFVVPHLNRIPFQLALLEYVGEVPLFYALNDSPRQVHSLLDVLDELQVAILDALAGLDVLYVEFVDNLDGVITNPKLFRRYCLPAFQRYAEVLHQQGKKLGSHTDGEMRPLVDLIPETGIDVCESFSPAPLTRCTFEEAWQAWRGGPLIWGGIPSTILERTTGERDFREHVARLLEMAGAGPIILGIGDQVLHNSLIERVCVIAEAAEAHSV